MCNVASRFFCMQPISVCHPPSASLVIIISINVIVDTR